MKQLHQFILRGRSVNLKTIIFCSVIFCLGILSFQTVVAQSARLDQWQRIDQKWEYGNLNRKHSNYLEGESVPYRILISGLTDGTQRSITFQFDISGPNSPVKHGIDYLTTFNRSVPEITDLNVGADVPNGFNFPAGPVQDITIPLPGNLEASSSLPDADRKMRIYGGSVDDIQYIDDGGSPIDNHKTATVRVWFTPDGSTDVALLFGGHLANDGDYPNVDDGAGGIHGAPYHTSLVQFGIQGNDSDPYENIGSQDRSVMVGLPNCETPIPDDCFDDMYACASPGLETAVFDLTNSTCTVDGWYTDLDFQNAISDPAQYVGSDGDIVYGKITSECGNATAYLTLHVNPLPTVSCPGNSSVCVSDASFALSGATPTGGTYTVDGVTATNFDPATAGVGGHTIVYTYSDGNSCSNTCSFTITVNDLPTVSCPGNSSVCLNDASFALSGATPVGGTYAVDGVTATNFDPATAGVGDHTITYTYSDGNCSNTCSFTITVNANPTVYTLSSNSFCNGTSTGSITLSSSQTGVSYELFKVGTPDVSISSKNGTGSSLTWTGLSDGTYYVVATNTTTQCTSTTAQITLTGSACGNTFTQGFYGNSTTNNKTCNGTTLSTLLNSLLGTALQVGGANKGVIVPTAGTPGSFKVNNQGSTVNTTSAAWLIKILPAGSTASSLLNGNNSILSSFFNYYTPTGYLTKQTKISNVLLGQTIALSLNIRLKNAGFSLFDLGAFSLDVSNAIMTAVPANPVVYINTTQFKQLTGGCTTALGNCTNSYPLAKNVLKALSTKTVQGLLDLANEALNSNGTTGYTKNGSTFTWAELNLTIDAINRAFDRGALFNTFGSVALSPCTNTQITSRSGNVTEQGVNADVSVSTYPNPFNRTVNFQITSPVSGNAKLEIFNLSGQRLKNISWGYVEAGQTRNFSVDMPKPITSTMLLYKIMVGNNEIRGKLIQLK